MPALRPTRKLFSLLLLFCQHHIAIGRITVHNVLSGKLDDRGGGPQLQPLDGVVAVKLADLLKQGWNCLLVRDDNLKFTIDPAIAEVNGGPIRPVDCLISCRIS